MVHHRKGDYVVSEHKNLVYLETVVDLFDTNTDLMLCGFPVISQRSKKHRKLGKY